MVAPNPHHRTQEQSIKARKHQLFEADDDHAHSGPRQSFAEILRVTPADPLTPAIKGILWVVGTLVILLLLAGFTTVGKRKPRPRPQPVENVRWEPDQPRGVGPGSLPG